MIHKRRENRRYFKNKKIKKRLSTIKELGFNDGSLYEKHKNKIEENGGGYMSKSGTLMHYAKGSKRTLKTNNKGNYGPAKLYKKHDMQELLDMKDQLDELDKDNV